MRRGIDASGIELGAYDRLMARAARRSPEPVSGIGPMTERVAEEIADAMFALSTPSRVQILGCLLDGPRSVGQLTEALGMEQSAVSHQLRVLREHSLVTVVERVGRRRVYGLFDEHVTALLEEALRHVEQRRQPGKRRAAPGRAVAANEA
jgi:ArsR family transcriptional regulator